MNRCAYCGLAGKTTKEHVWPKALIDKYEGLRTYNPQTNRFYAGEPVVKDVCARCNNGPLSSLDSYLSSLYDRHFSAIVEAGEAARLEYDYDLLLRALLKISYNASRNSGNGMSISLHERLTEFILRGGYCPKLMLRLQIVTASTAINLRDHSESAFRPVLMRCGMLAYDGPLHRRFVVRMIAINSFWFYLFIPYKEEPAHKWREFMGGVTNWWTPLGVPVTKQDSRIDIPVERTTYFDMRLLGSLLTADPR